MEEAPRSCLSGAVAGNLHVGNPQPGGSDGEGGLACRELAEATRQTQTERNGSAESCLANPQPRPDHQPLQYSTTEGDERVQWTREVVYIHGSKWLI